MRVPAMRNWVNDVGENAIRSDDYMNVMYIIY